MKKERDSMDTYFAYLDALRESGAINMYGALPYLQKEFTELGFDQQRASGVLKSWMESFGKEQG